MEILFYILAAAGAGVGTGLAGLSAATVMVPILIVLCPSFSGEFGPYQATAIALASDILGSAVTSYTYAKNKKIDLKHGWILLACIVSMSTVGSLVAYLAGATVLGGFTLILTFCIGIRFLVKPDTSKKEGEAREVCLGRREIAISLFFGLTIGFGTGFVGTGGGMMMLVVFTVFLGYELKTAVGTSTFIMTFTALIAFTSHALIHPAVVIERWGVLALCIAVATGTSLLSARFANRVDNRTVGLTTGVVLTILGAILIYLNYFSDMALPPLVLEFLQTLGTLLAFLAVAIAAILVLFFVVGIRGELRRKLLHAIAFLLGPVMMTRAEHWYVVSIICVLMAVAIYPILRAFERHRGYATLFVQRRMGEVKESLLLLFFTEAGLTALFWGALGSRFTVVTAILAWGFGDAAAALVGRKFGRHKWQLPFADGKKSVEGSAAMFAVAVVLVGACLLRNGGTVAAAVAVSVVTATAATMTELATKGGYDTVTVPVVAAVVLQLGLWFV